MCLACSKCGNEVAKVKKVRNQLQWDTIKHQHEVSALLKLSEIQSFSFPFSFLWIFINSPNRVTLPWLWQSEVVSHTISWVVSLAHVTLCLPLLLWISFLFFFEVIYCASSVFLQKTKHSIPFLGSSFQHTAVTSPALKSNASGTFCYSPKALACLAISHWQSRPKNMHEKTTAAAP